MQIPRRNDLRNIAIVAHVDHGKTTLVDAMLRQTGLLSQKSGETQEPSLDSNVLEKERGITILAKNTAVPYQDVMINIVDTPGHADFGGEVERILKMVDGVLLLVDAVDGPMPQTRFVLRKSLELGLCPIVVVNKVDRPNAKPQEALNRTFDLFADLGASDPQLDFPVVYASAKQGWASYHGESLGENLRPLFETILKHVPPPAADAEKPLQMLVTMLDYSDFLGRIGIGRIVCGKVSKNQTVAMINAQGEKRLCRVTQIQGFRGLRRVEAGEAKAGDIVALAGLEGVQVGETVASGENPQALPPLTIDEPTLSMDFVVNDSPFAGLEGEFLTTRHLRERLFKERQTNVGLTVEEFGETGVFLVSGRGELHLSILIETMRREGYEFAVSKPEVICKKEGDLILEPTEYLLLDIEQEHQGAVFESMGRRGGVMKDMSSEGRRMRLEYVIPSRSLMGFKSEFLILTRGMGTMHHSFHGYAPKSGELAGRQNGVMIAMERGSTTRYALDNLQQRGVLFVGPGVPVYEGMIVGQHSRDNDIVVNPCKQKAMTNMRSKASDEAAMLTPPRILSLEQSIEFIAEDELVEVTPKNIRLRKKILNASLRKRSEKEVD